MQDAHAHSIRVLLRNEAGLYLQPSGEWGENRETARRFKNSSFAYFWAKEQELIRSSIIIAFPDRNRDMSIRVVW